MKVAVLWSGGKDSCLACQRAMSQDYDVAALVTFILDSWPSLCHPLSIMSLQSKALGIPHTTARLREPYREAYRQSVSKLMRTDGIQGIVTGDIWIENHRRWMEDVCEGLNIDVIMPLWNEDGHHLLDAVISSGFRPVFTCVKEPWFDTDWLGRQLDRRRVEALRSLQERFGIDVCGENGEYHTMVLDGPIFKRSITIEEFTPDRKNSTLFLRPQRVSLRSKGV
jgi:diphthine-ammonia ligase